MSKKHLSPEIVSLIHHVELNDTGWWKKAVSQVVRGVLWKSPSALSPEEVQTGLHRELGIRLQEGVLTKQLELLISQGSVTRFPGGTFKLTEQTRQQLSAAHANAVAEQEGCSAHFLASCLEHCPALDSTLVWEEFSRALLSAIHVTGANLFHLLADGVLEKDVDWLTTFLSKFEMQHQEGLRLVLASFFSPSNNSCRNQVLRLLSAHFFAEATQLKAETLALLESESKVKIVRIVLDTNFIFSVLGLHDNPGDEAVLSLVDIAKKTANKLDMRFLVLPSTLDEAQGVLLKQMQNIAKIRTTVAMSRAAVTQPLPSVAKKFFDAASRVPGLTAEMFFKPYIEDLRTILRDKGISVLEAHQTIYNQRQDVIDDVMTELEREEIELPEPKRKGYSTLLHDAVLWHAVHDRRQSDANSPFEVEYWAVSIDWRLIAFDRKKRASNATKLPVVLHPSNLVQLMQFWVPRSMELDASLVDSLRLPLFFHAFDPEDERATVKVLEAMSRFENVGDLPEKSIKLVLANQALRSRIRQGDASNDEVFELIHDELLLEHKETVAQLESTQGAMLASRQQLAEEKRERLLSIEDKNIAEKALEEAEGRVQAAEQKLEEKQLRERGLERQQYALNFLVFPLMLGVLLVLLSYGEVVKLLPTLSVGWARWAFIFGLGCLPLACGCVLSTWRTPKSEHLSDWWLARGASHVGKKGVLLPLTSIFSAVFAGGTWDLVKAAIGFNP